MRTSALIRLLLVFAVVFSLLGIPNLGPSPTIPSLQLGHADAAPNVQWIPAGPAMDTLAYNIFTDASSEYTALQTTPSPIDFVDWPIPPGFSCPTGVGCPNFQITSPVNETGYSEIEFHMGQNWWGCQFNYGNAACGTNIRQAFAHAVDKNIFITNQLGGAAVPIDNPVPPSVDLNTPDPCAWDTSHIQSGPGCIVNGPSGTAYHLATAAAGNCTSKPTFPWTPGCGTPDFCAAADHMIAAGVATGKDATTCVLTGISSAVAANPTQIFVRSDNSPSLNVGNSYGQFICGLFTGTFSTGCTGIFTVTPGPITAFPGFVSCGSPGLPACNNSIPLTWWAFTARFDNVLTFDKSLFFRYDSQFVSGISAIQAPNGPCSTKSIPTFPPGNYMYLCNSSYDSNIEQAEFAPCLTAPGDPTPGQTHLTVIFANCPGTSVPSAASASYKAQDIFGQNAYTIPLWSGKNAYAYLTGWQGGVLHKGNGFTPPGNYFTTLDAWNPSPPVAGQVRQGYAQSTDSVNPFIGSTPWDNGVVGSIWDSPGTTNPDSPQSYMDWMTIKTDQVPSLTLSYVPPPGTVGAFRYTLRNDIFWQTGQKVTAWDLAFSYIAFRSSGVAPGLASMTGVKVLSPTQVDVDVNAIGPFTKLFLSNPILPGRDWVNTSVCTPAAWDSAASDQNFAAANNFLTACIASSAAVTASGVIQPISGDSNVDSNKIAPTYNPEKSGNLIGSGPWMCGSGSSIGGPGCGPCGCTGNPSPGSWVLTRYGKGTAPGSTLNTYFRDSGNLALWAWSGDRGNFSADFLDFGVVVGLCFGKPVGTSGCTVWQHGIGGTPSGTPVGLQQVSIVERFVGVNWVQPYNWINSAPQNIVPFPPVLHEGSVTLNPCSVDSVNGYDC